MDREQVLSLAPDSASVAAAKKLDNAATWPSLGYNDLAVWGECKGSGSKPYLTRIDLTGNAFKCSCPSRKFPCKHGLALYLLFVDNRKSFTQSADAPDWVSEWLTSRNAAVEKKKAKADKPVDEKAQQKRQQKREEKVQQGIQDLSRWLQDSVRVGIADLQNKPFKYWDELSARMVDAQAPGLANRVRHMGNLLAGRDNSLNAFVFEMGRLHLLLQAYQKLSALPPALQADAMTYVGWQTTEAEVLKSEPVEDKWRVLGRRISEDNNIITQEVWFLGENSQRFAKQINFAHGSQRHTLMCQWTSGSLLQGPMYFYPSVTPLRAIAGDLKSCKGFFEQAFGDSLPSVDEVLDQTCRLKALNPWLVQYPVVFKQVLPYWADDQLFFGVGADHCVVGETKDVLYWNLLALTGGTSADIFGEWDGHQFKALGMWCEDSYQSLVAGVVE